MKMDTRETTQLQQRIAGGDQPAFEQLYRLFFPRLFQFAMLYLHRRELAEEIVNDVMLRIWNRRDQLHLISNIETYLFVAARNQSLNYLSQYSQYHVQFEPEKGQAEMVNLNDPSQLLEWKEIYFQLNQAIEELPEQCRTVFRLVKEEGFKYKEAAEILNISPRTVETQLFRAIKKLQRIAEAFTGSPRNRKNNFLPVILLFQIFSAFL